MLQLDPVAKAKLRAQLDELPTNDLFMLNFLAQWRKISRRNQRPPAEPWNTWIQMAGRGFGKTRSGAQWICDKALRNPGTFWGVVAPTANDLLKICFEGPSGIISILPKQLIADYVTSPHPLLTMHNGSQLQGYSAQEPERLRGPNLHGAWADELAAWQYMQLAFDMLKFCLRLGTHPQLMITTTPKPYPLLRRLMSEPNTVVTRGSTHDNRANLAPTFFDEIIKYEGTQIGKQEIYGELLDFAESGIFKLSWFKFWPAVDKDGKAVPLPKFHYLLQSYDTAFKTKQSNDPSAGTTWGVFRPDDKSPMGVMLLDAWDERLSYPDLREKLRAEYGNVFGADDKAIDEVLIEDKASGQALLPDLQRAGIPVEPYSVPGDLDKVQRAHGVSHLVKHGHVWLPESLKYSGQTPPVVRAWAQRFLDQVTAFGPEMFKELERVRRAATVGTDTAIEDNMAHDDYVDTFTQMLAWLRDSEWLRLPADTADLPEPEEQKKLANPYSPRR